MSGPTAIRWTGWAGPPGRGGSVPLSDNSRSRVPRVGPVRISEEMETGKGKAAKQLNRGLGETSTLQRTSCGENFSDRVCTVCTMGATVGHTCPTL